MLGVLGGMGPAATVDFLDKFVALTPAIRDQEHLPVLVNFAPQIPDRSAAILGNGPSPLPAMQRALHILVAGGVRAIAIPCNTSHHWHEELQAGCPVPILHIADAVAQAVSQQTDLYPVMILATRGTLQSGFYQRRLDSQHQPWCLPKPDEQIEVDRVIALVKAGGAPEASKILEALWERWSGRTGRLIFACTELPIAAATLGTSPFKLFDSNHELAHHCIDFCLAQR